MALEYFLILEMAGNFPGSPDRDRVRISEAEHDRLFDTYIRKGPAPQRPERETHQCPICDRLYYIDEDHCPGCGWSPGWSPARNPEPLSQQ